MSSNFDERIRVVDALRGFALFGILYAHILLWYSAGALPENVYRENMDIASGIVSGLYFIFILAKFFSIFSFLFGLSFYIQMKSLMKRNDNFIIRFGWRLAILGVIGLIHHAVWRGDILSIYVPLGFLLIFARNLSNRTILIIGAVLILNIPTKVYEMSFLYMNGQMPFTNPNLQQDAAHYYDVIKHGSFMEVVVDNIKAWPVKLEYQLSSGRLIITFGFFLLGMFVGRMQWFEKLEETRPIIKKIWKKTGFVLIGIIATAVVLGALNAGLGLNLEKNLWVTWAAGFLVDLFNGSATIFYITGFTLLMFREKWSRFLMPLENVGKMALTSYLTQTLFGLLLFYGFGLGLVTVTSPAANALICIGIFSIQIIFSRWWLQHFYYGPVEWLWRSTTFLKAQKMKKSDTSLPLANPQI
jgi:uncharacterized protein